MEETIPEVTPVEETPVEAPIEPIVEEQTQEPTPPDQKQIFKDGYDKLVETTGYCIEFRPEYLLRDDGTYSLVVNTLIAVKK